MTLWPSRLQSTKKTVAVAPLQEAAREAVDAGSEGEEAREEEEVARAREAAAVDVADSRLVTLPLHQSPKRRLTS